MDRSALKNGDYCSATDFNGDTVKGHIVGEPGVLPLYFMLDGEQGVMVGVDRLSNFQPIYSEKTPEQAKEELDSQTDKEVEPGTPYQAFSGFSQKVPDPTNANASAQSAEAHKDDVKTD